MVKQDSRLLGFVATRHPGSGCGCETRPMSPGTSGWDNIKAFSRSPEVKYPGGKISRKREEAVELRRLPGLVVLRSEATPDI